MPNTQNNSIKSTNLQLLNYITRLNIIVNPVQFDLKDEDIQRPRKRIKTK